jgi:hypothetical protein
MGVSMSKKAPTADALTRFVILYLLAEWRDTGFRSRRLPFASFMLAYVWAVLRGGPFHSLLYTITGLVFPPNPKVSGHVGAGYELVKRAFEANFEEGMERGAQFVVFVKGEKVGRNGGSTHPQKRPSLTAPSCHYHYQVIDLSGSQGQDNSTYNEESVQVIMSSTKNITALGTPYPQRSPPTFT